MTWLSGKKAYIIGGLTIAIGIVQSNLMINKEITHER